MKVEFSGYVCASVQVRAHGTPQIVCMDTWSPQSPILGTGQHTGALQGSSPQLFPVHNGI